MSSLDEPCPCGSGYPMAACCAPYLADLAPAPSAEKLMRSRYTAYTLGRTDYLRETWHPETRPTLLSVDGPRKWLGLEVKSVVAGNAGDSVGTVEFVARFKENGRAHRMHEVSQFRFVDGRWYYLGGATKGR